METSLLMQNRAKMIFPFIAMVISAQSATAEIVSSHNEQHVAQQAAQNFLLDKDCARTQISRTERFRIDAQQDSVKILGQEFIVACIEKKQAIDPAKIFQLNWNLPSSREDGKVLSQSEIRGFQVIINGSIAAMVSGTSFTTDKIIPPAEFAVRTVDVDGLISADSNVVKVN